MPPSSQDCRKFAAQNSRKMATVKSEIGKPKKDGLRKVSIIICHAGGRKRIPTNIYFEASDITRSGNIGNKEKKHLIDDIIDKYRNRIYKVEVEYTGIALTVDELVAKITAKKDSDLDFFAFAEDWIERAHLIYKDGHRATLNSLEKFLGRRKLSFSEITYDFLTRYCDSLSGMQRAPSKHLGNIRQLFKEARLTYNTETQTLIPNQPFERFKVPKDRPKNKERDIDVATLRKIIAYKGTGLRGFARDCYVLSFFLIGMNSADMYDARDIRDGKICYKRQKTRTRRDDEAYIEVTILDEIKPLVKKYRGNSRVFSFYSKYVSSENFNKALNNGLKKLCDTLGIRKIEFYSARHSWATIARNELGIDKGTVSDALNHIDDDMAITDRYIKRDFKNINDANRKVADYVLGEK